MPALRHVLKRMTDETASSDRDQLAAEYALSLLTGEELLQARGLMASDPEFAAMVAMWERQLAPLHDETAERAPSPELWERIAEQTQGAAPTGAVVSLQAKVRRWQWVSGLTAVAAATALAFAVAPTLQPEQTTITAPTAQAPLVASIPIGDTPLRLGVTYLPEREEMLVSASGLSADGVHDHELWLVVDEGDARSLGVVAPGEERRMTLEDDLANQIADGAALVLTREPLGGAVPGTDAGPVVAEGKFSTI